MERKGSGTGRQEPGATWEPRVGLDGGRLRSAMLPGGMRQKLEFSFGQSDLVHSDDVGSDRFRYEQAGHLLRLLPDPIPVEDQARCEAACVCDDEHDDK